jgi:hypothetical protein
MNTCDFTQGTISHNLKDPHSKSLEPDCLSPHLAITTQSLDGRGSEGGADTVHACLPRLRSINSAGPGPVGKGTDTI